MATIPIEIILQDAETPVDPTPTPEETNIIVPDTGAGVVGSGSTFSSSPAASIILPAILLAVALATVCTVLIHKYRKHQNSDKISKKEKLATVASGTIAILAATVLVGNLVIPATSAATDDTNTNREGELVVDDKITITVTREADSDEAIVSSIDTKSYATVYKTFGYEVAIAMAGNTTNLYLNGDTSSEYYIAPVSDGTLADNTWGYTLDGEEYTAMPLIDDLAVVARGTTPVSNEEVDINYGVKVASDMPAGTYTGELEYILADTGFPAALRTMQDMTTAICSSVPTPNPFKADNTTIEDNVPTIMLPDSRDNKLYRIAKLADGKCWMTQNLDLQKEDLVVSVLDDTNTDNPANGFTLPISQTEGDESWGYYSDETAINTPRVYSIEENSEETYKYCIKFQYGNCIEQGDIIQIGELGNLYNWHTATAGTGVYNTSSTKESSFVATGSICPAGWSLPNNSNSGEATDYSVLLYRYGITNSSTFPINYASADKIAFYKAPISLVPTGGYANGLISVGKRGSIWSSLANDKDAAKVFNFESGMASLWYPSDKYMGYAIRCVAR